MRVMSCLVICSSMLSCSKWCTSDLRFFRLVPLCVVFPALPVHTLGEVGDFTNTMQRLLDTIGATDGLILHRKMKIGTK
jgi:hypothetical protein